MLNSNLYLIRFITPKNIIFLSLFSFLHIITVYERLNWKKNKLNSFRIPGDFMKPYQIQMPFFLSLTYTHHFIPYNILYCQKYEHFIIFFFATGQFQVLYQLHLLFHHYLYIEHIFFLNFLSLFHSILFLVVYSYNTFLFTPLRLLITKMGHMLIFYHSYTNYK